MRSSPQKCPPRIDSSSSAALLNDSRPTSKVRIDARHFPTDESLLDTESTLLIENIHHTLTIHAEMFRRILETTPRPSLLLAELLEDTGKRYLDFSELISAEFRRDL
jgi:hypothetical protein